MQDLDLHKLYYELWGVFKNDEILMELGGGAGFEACRTRRNCLELIRMIGSSQKKLLLAAKDRDIYRALEEQCQSRAPDFMIIKGVIQIFSKLIIQRLMAQDQNRLRQ